MSRVTTADDRSTALTRYVERLADELELRDWRIYLVEEDPGEGNIGLCKTMYGRKVAQIAYHPQLDPEELRHTLTHELVHLHIDAASSMVMNEMDNLVGEVVGKTFYLAYRRLIEYGVDGITSALEKHLPAPPPAKAAA